MYDMNVSFFPGLPLRPELELQCKSGHEDLGERALSPSENEHDKQMGVLKGFYILINAPGPLDCVDSERIGHGRLISILCSVFESYMIMKTLIFYQRLADLFAKRGKTISFGRAKILCPPYPALTIKVAPLGVISI